MTLKDRGYWVSNFWASTVYSRMYRVSILGVVIMIWERIPHSST